MTGIDLTFMRRVYPASAILVVLASVCAMVLHGFYPAFGVLFGGLFGIINMMLLARLIQAVLHPGPRDPIEVAVTFFVKFPLAIGVLCLVFWLGWIDPMGFLVGFPIILATALVAAIIHYYIGSGRRIPEGEKSE